jgi:hypothetical protein
MVAPRGLLAALRKLGWLLTAAACFIGEMGIWSCAVSLRESNLNGTRGAKSDVVAVFTPVLFEFGEFLILFHRYWSG